MTMDGFANTQHTKERQAAVAAGGNKASFPKASPKMVYALPLTALL